MTVQVLVVDPERKRVSLTAKKTLVESSLPIIAQFSDAQVGVLTHAVVFKVSDKSLQVEFYNNLKAIIPAREARCVLHPRSDTFIVLNLLIPQRDHRRAIVSCFPPRQACTRPQHCGGV